MKLFSFSRVGWTSFFSFLMVFYEIFCPYWNLIKLQNYVWLITVSSRWVLDFTKLSNSPGQPKKKTTTLWVLNAFYNFFLWCLISSEQLRLFTRKDASQPSNVLLQNIFLWLHTYAEGSNFYQSFFIVKMWQRKCKDGKNEIWMNVNWIKMRKKWNYWCSRTRAVTMTKKNSTEERERFFVNTKRRLLCRRCVNLCKAKFLEEA